MTTTTITSITLFEKNAAWLEIHLSFFVFNVAKVTLEGIVGEIFSTVESFLDELEDKKNTTMLLRDSLHPLKRLTAIYHFTLLYAHSDNIDLNKNLSNFIEITSVF